MQALKTLILQLPHGCSMRTWADGSFHVLYQEQDAIKVRNWLAELSNNMTTVCIQNANARRVAADRSIEERREAVKPTSEVDSINREIEDLQSQYVPRFTEQDSEALAGIERGKAQPSTKAPVVAPQPDVPSTATILSSENGRVIETARVPVAMNGTGSVG